MGNCEFREYGMTLRQALELEDHIKGLGVRKTITDLTDYLPPKK
ncbi:21165_t:CDS:2 [Rhizophagus irregularis]|nr:21165_t:CDS:2 [Rhizophagus irregularis]